MSLARSLYPDINKERDYEPIINSFGTVLARCDDDKHWSGTTMVLLRSERCGRYGVLVFCWSAQSGIDPLNECVNYDEIDEIIEWLNSKIEWFDTLDAAKVYITNDAEHEGKYFYRYKAWEQFKSAVQEL